jgi:hypothetical protein
MAEDAVGSETGSPGRISLILCLSNLLMIPFSRPKEQGALLGVTGELLGIAGKILGIAGKSSVRIANGGRVWVSVH